MSSAEAVAEAAATRDRARPWPAAIAARGVAHVATTGGSSAPGVYRRLGRSPLRETVDWSRVHVWWGDDRFVPPDHPLSNVLPFTQILLASGGDEEGGSPEGADVGGAGDGVRIPAEHIHQVPVAEAIAHSGGPAWAAAVYARVAPGGRAARRRRRRPGVRRGRAGRRVPTGTSCRCSRLAGVGRDRDRRRRPGPDPHRAPRRRASRSIRGSSRCAERVVLLTTGASKADVLGPGLGRRGRARAAGRRGPRPERGRGSSTRRPRPASRSRSALARAVPRRADAARGRARRHARSPCSPAGAGRPLLLVHGTTADHRTWRGGRPRARDALAARTRSTGAGAGRLGRRRRRRRRYAIEREFDDLAAVADALAGERGRARRRRRSLAGRADRARGEPADAGHPADRRVRGCAAAAGRGGAGPGARRRACAPTSRPATSTGCSRGS